MLSKNQIKYITQLKQKKYRDLHKIFIAEGFKVIEELLNSSLELVHIYSTSYIDFKVSNNQLTLISLDELKKISNLSTPNQCLALFKMKDIQLPVNKGLKVALDDVRDPGNLGTIIRLCDWFGIEDLICSHESVDVYNPKVVQATMGSLTRVNVFYTDLVAYLKEYNHDIYGTFMDGANVYKETLADNGIIVMGNEANGISNEIEQMVTKKIAIPRFGTLQETESLNVATATAIILSEFKRSNSVSK
ncbi:RNA methyltransferase [Flavobacterium sp. xlx-214]|uniref:RNA methyltransferase n=1 Tax=unclassified Flavobacterium TaxID=196869 RepID=UPI0013D6822A|nr:MULTISPECIES: RNA methyltransferase [unclassified Flavobacterium]MBA5792274.1 RNA methyltransferase [Flavobacterium sp. xlx-221]QMI82409.1 RNA methyltransferase [Flavobacterium sp. xlx-214]